jgi:dipeptidyl aminopeptidase/acylaminoacyl peptidase
MTYRSIFSGLACILVFALQPLFADTIPTRAFVDNSQVRSLEISPDGEHVALTYEEGTQVKLAIMNLDSEEIITAFEFGTNMHVLNYWWGSNSRIVMSVGEVTGVLDTMGRPSSLYAADIDGSRREEIFDTQRSSYQMLNPLPDDERRVLIARRHWADEGEPRANYLDMFDGEMRPLANQPVDNDLSAIMVDNDGELRIGAATKMGDTLDDIELRLYVRHDEEWRQLDFDSKRSPVSVNILGFSSDNRQAYFVSNHDVAEDDTMGVFRYDFDTGEMELLHRNPEMNVSGLIRAPDRTVLGATTRFGPMNYVLFDDKVVDNMDAARMLQSVVTSFPGNDVTYTSASQDGSLAIVYVRGDRNPGEFYLLDTETMEMRFLVGSLPDLPTEQLVPMRPVTIEARDGLKLHALLTMPADVDENAPLVVNVHGGPFGITDTWGYHREAQLFAHHGYATLQVNFRGSGNRGDDFMRAGWREWGGKMQDDVTDATRWAIEQGHADADRICIYGGSYGGYATLMGVVKEPNLYQCGVGIVGVYDLVWFREGDGSDFSRQRTAGRQARQNFERFMSSAVGDDLDELRKVSPVHHVGRIEAELFIIHGGSDVRVPVGHAERLRKALDEIGKSYEWMLKEDEGHGFYDVGNRVEMYDAVLEFLERNIGSNATGD